MEKIDIVLLKLETITELNTIQMNLIEGEHYQSAALVGKRLGAVLEQFRITLESLKPEPEKEKVDAAQQ